MAFAADTARKDVGPAAGALVHVAVVHGPGEVCLVAAGLTGDAMLEQLALQLLLEADLQLWDEDAARYRQLVSAGRSGDAVEFYFARVGERWDAQRVSFHEVRC